LIAFGRFLSDPPQSEPSQDPVKSAQRAYESAIKTRSGQIEQKGGKEHTGCKPSPFVMSLGCRDKVNGRVRNREKQEVHRTVHKWDRIEKSGHQRNRIGPIELEKGKIPDA
jgi:hypothetical protein